MLRSLAILIPRKNLSSSCASRCFRAAFCGPSPVRFLSDVPKRSPVKRFNEAKQNSFWKKFDAWFEAPPKRIHQTTAERNKTTLTYLVSLCILTVGASYAAVPLYRVFCQSSGYGGTVKTGHDASKVATMKTNKERTITVKFNADTAATMQWNFRPQQSEVKL